MVRKQRELQAEIERQKKEAEAQRRNHRHRNHRKKEDAAEEADSRSRTPDAGFRGEEIRADSPPIPSMRGERKKKPLKNQ